MNLITQFLQTAGASAIAGGVGKQQAEPSAQERAAQVTQQGQQGNNQLLSLLQQMQQPQQQQPTMGLMSLFKRQ